MVVLMFEKKLLIIITDPLTDRIFFEGNVIHELLKLDIGIYVQYLFDGKKLLLSKAKAKVVEVNIFEEYDLTLFSKAKLYAYKWLDNNFGFMPIAVRMNIFDGFNPSIVAKNHRNGFYNLSKIGPLPNTLFFYRLMKWFYRKVFSLYKDNRIVQFCHDHRITAIILSNSQSPAVQNVSSSAIRSNIPVIGYIASWDHPVGKGLIPTHFSRYIVQNKQMVTDLVTYHQVDDSKIVITGWPQMDIYATDFSGEEYKKFLTGKNLNSQLPTVLFACNSETNSPNEHRIMDDILESQRKIDSSESWNAIIRPHPKDASGRFDFLSSKYKCVHVQSPSYADLDILAMLLQHVNCVVCSGGSILLDAVANDRPVVSINFDPYDSGDHALINNFERFHYKRLESYDAYMKSYSYDNLLETITQQLLHPDMLKHSRTKLKNDYIGRLDGRAASNVAKVVDDVLNQG